MCELCLFVSNQSPFSASSGPLDVVPQAIISDGSLPIGARALAEWSWNQGGAVGQAASVTYSFNQATSNGFYSPFNSTQQANAIKAFGELSAVANITYVDHTGQGTAKISLNNGQLDSLGSTGIKGVAFLGFNPNTGQLSSAPVVMDTDGMGNFVPGNFAYMALMHEIGHASGLKHPFDGNPTVSGIDNGVAHSIMSYSGYTGQSPESGSYVVTRDMPITPMYNDIIALQHIYGANNSFNTGDDVYTFSEYGFANARTLWDAGGTDTILRASATSGERIDLQDGGGDSNVNIFNGGNTIAFIAKGAVIENVIAGSGSDFIQGNDVGNELYGGHGTDVIRGEGGGDVIFGGTGFSDANDLNDTIYGGDGRDLILGNAGNDRLFGDNGAAGNGNNDTIYGGAGSDFINGEQGFDLIVGGPGQDSLYGGADADVFAFGNDVSGSVNIIYDFQGAGGPGGDLIRILYDVNGSGITSAADVIANIVEGSGHSYIQLAGSSGGSAILVAFTQGLTVDDIAIVDTNGLLAPVG